MILDHSLVDGDGRKIGVVTEECLGETLEKGKPKDELPDMRLLVSKHDPRSLKEGSHYHMNSLMCDAHGGGEPYCAFQSLDSGFQLQKILKYLRDARDGNTCCASDCVLSAVICITRVGPGCPLACVYYAFDE